MADVLIKSETMASIADAIREKLGVSNTYFPSEMPDAIKSIEGGGGEIKYVLNFINGGYINTDDGSVVSYSSWKYSDYVPIIAPKLIVTSNETATNYNAFYDKDKQYISGFLLNEVVDIPSNAAYFRISVGKEFDAIATGIDKQHETPAITDITFAEDYSALATTVDGDIREITPTMVDGVITEIDVDGSKIAVEYDEDGYLAKVGSVDIDMGGLVGDWYTIYSQVPGRDVSITIDQYERYKKFAFISGWNTINPPFTEYPEGWTDISKSELESGTLNIRNADGNSGYYVTNNSGVLSISPYCISYAPSKSSVAVGIIGWK